jgi:hypothetical protein
VGIDVDGRVDDNESNLVSGAPFVRAHAADLKRQNIERNKEIQR